MSTPSPAGESAYPLRVYGRLDADTSRWLWLLKWLMIIPHIVVLTFLWIAAIFTTIVAGFGILFYHPVSADHLRVQRRRDPMDLAGVLLRVRGLRPRSLSAVQPCL